MNKLFRWKTLYLLCVGIMSLGIFSACSDDMADSPNNQTQTHQIDPLGSYIGKVNMAIEATVMPIGDNAARLQYILGPRELKKAVHGGTFRTDGGALGEGEYEPETGGIIDNNSPDGPLDNDSYNDKYLAPFLSIGQIGSKIPGYLVLIYDDGSARPTVFRQAVNFEVIETVKLVQGSGADAHGGYKLEGQNRVRFTGDINFPASMTLNKAFENGTTSSDQVNSIDNNSPISQDVLDEIRAHGAVLRKSKWKVQAYLGYSDEGGTDNKVYFGTDKTQNPKDNSTATAFAPKVNNSAELHTPCISEWTDLYIAGGPNLVRDKTQYTAINSKLKFKPQGLLLQYDVDVEMFDPTYVRSAGLISNALTFAGYYNLSDESIREAYNQRATDTKGVPEFNEILKPTMEQANLMLRYPADEVKALTTETDPTKYMYPFYMPQLIDNSVTGLDPATDHKITLGGTPVVSMHSANVTLGAGTDLGSRRIFTFWAMPRKTKPATPHTYMFLKTGQETSADAGSQPTHVLHQTTKDFSTSKGHVVYAKGILNSNLIFSEVLSHTNPEGEELPKASLVELYNPMAYPVRLDNYYLVGILEDEGDPGKMKFVKKPYNEPRSSEFTTNLSEAYLVPLKKLLSQDKPAAGEGRVGSVFDAHTDESEEFYIPSMGTTQYLELTGVGSDADYHYLLPGQTLLIGGSVWHNYAIGNGDEFYGEIEQKLTDAASGDGGYQLKGFFYHATKDDDDKPASPLNFKPGEGVALIKVVDGQRYIIDATAPIKSRAKIPFAGAFDAYKAETTPHADENFFIMTRKDNVNFPFIPPYRTQRLTGGRWSDDWTISTDKDTFTPGWRSTANLERTWHNINGTWERTPLAKWETYLKARPAKN